ncbi:MAG: ADP-heptose synthase, bifunctional sugar kinase/adenylyltransferase [Bacteroidetes bacterium]|nr:ADP-heptose synthase, bifunctional sugar kinase/adenylyltransferase [Bacteroidota bacterium]
MQQHNNTTIQQIFNSFNKLNVLIIGDVMIDAYMWGNVNRISPEAPVPVVAVSKRENRLGGAANVALNIQAMGANPVLCSLVGNDEGGKLFSSLLKKQKLSAEGILKSKSRITTIKTRVLGGSHQMIRVDEEDDAPVNEKETAALFAEIKKIISGKKIDVIIFEDYDKGCITTELIRSVVALAKQKSIPLVVDPKKRNFMAYTGVTLFKPNLKELREGLKVEFDSSNMKELTKIVDSFIKKQGIDSALITLSEKGVYINDKKIKTLIPAHVRDITDVSGAGDTVVSIAALCVALKLPAETVAVLANLAGGLVCEKVGVVPVNKKELLEEALKLNS